MILHQVAQKAEDLDRAIDFYTRLIGDPPIATFDPPGLAFFRLGNTRLLIERGAPSALIYLRVDDVRATIERLRSEGVVIVGEPHVIFSDATGMFGPAGADEWMAFINDSEGNLVGLSSQNTPVTRQHPRDTRVNPGRARFPYWGYSHRAQRGFAGQAARADLMRERASSISSSVVWKLVTRRTTSAAMR